MPRSAASRSAARSSTSTPRCTSPARRPSSRPAPANFKGAKFELVDGSGRGAAKDAQLHDQTELDLEGVRYTVCPPGNDDWQIKAQKHLARPEERAPARRATCGSTSRACRSSTRRGSRSRSATSASRACCFPRIGSGGKTGTQIVVPWYWNIAPNYDATFTSRYFSSRGYRIDPEFRYLTERSRGTLEAAVPAARHGARGRARPVRSSRTRRCSSRARGRWSTPRTSPTTRTSRTSASASRAPASSS